MFNLSGSEIIVILLLALVVLGPEKLPEALRRAGRTYAELKRMGNSFQDEVRSALDEPAKEMRETADLLRTTVTDTTSAVTGTTARPASPRRPNVPATPPAAAKPSEPPPAGEPAAPDEELINRTLSGHPSPATDEHPAS
jgi:sec-independent protein translocase protein TatB